LTKAREAESFDEVGILMVERFAPTRKEIYSTIRFDGNSAVSFQLNFVGPIWSLRELKHFSGAIRGH